MPDNVEDVYQLDKCLDWIIGNAFKRVILQFKSDKLEDSTLVVSQLNNAHSLRLSKQVEPAKKLDLYVTQSNTCCVDLIVTQHVSNVDAVIHFGKACLSKSVLVHQDQSELPVLFAFTHGRQEPVLFKSNVEKIINHLESIVSINSNCPIIVFYDTDHTDYAQCIHGLVQKKQLDKYIEVAKLVLPSSTWLTTAEQSLMDQNSKHHVGHYGLSKSLDEYKSAICLSEKPAINLTLQSPSNMWKVDCSKDVVIEKVNVSRILNKRMALVNRLKDDEELKFGVIITNPLPDITETLSRLGKYATVRKHILYPISMIQTIDECKIGNFDLCDAFIVVNSCTCSTILESLYFNRPIISDIEFRLVCGFETVYGRVVWPCSDSHLSAEDIFNKRKVSDVSLALIHSRNELLERCSVARTNLWAGLDYKTPEISSASGDPSDSFGGLAIEEGLHGIASTYKSEPLKKSSAKNDD